MLYRNKMVALATLLIMVSSGLTSVFLFTLPTDTNNSNQATDINVDELLKQMGTQDSGNVQQTLTNINENNQMQAFQKLMDSEMSKPGVEGTRKVSQDVEIDKLLSDFTYKTSKCLYYFRSCKLFPISE